MDQRSADQLSEDRVRAEGRRGAFLCHVRVLHRLFRCLLYTSDAADERSSVDLGGRRIIKKTTTEITVKDTAHQKQ